MPQIRLGAVDYLNARPLVHTLDRAPDRFSIRFDVPSHCATLLHDGHIDLGLIPSIEYLRGPDYRIVPGVAIASCGPVASVALFSARPVAAIRSIAVDSGSRTSVALLRLLCARRFGIDPALETRPPDLASMLERCDAAMIIGDAALFADPKAAGLDTIDLGAEWTAMTDLPFVWAFWAGRPAAESPGLAAALQAARDAGVGAADEIARAYCGGDGARARLGARYLRENIRFGLGDGEQAGLRRFYEEAGRLGIAEAGGAPRFFEG